MPYECKASGLPLLAMCLQGQVLKDEGVVTVNAAIENPSGVDDDILDRLGRLPQVKQVNSSTGPEDQLWRELTSYSLGLSATARRVQDASTLMLVLS